MACVLIPPGRNLDTLSKRDNPAVSGRVPVKAGVFDVLQGSSMPGQRGHGGGNSAKLMQYTGYRLIGRRLKTHDLTH